MAVCVQVCLSFCVLFLPLFQFALFLQDHGFDFPYGSNHLPIVNFLYTYIETSTLKEILLDSRHKRWQKNTTHCEDQRGLAKLARVTLYRTYGDFDIWHFDTRNGFFFQVGGMRFLKQCLQALPPSPFHSRIPLAADPACRPLAFTIVLTDREPGTGYLSNNLSAVSVLAQNYNACTFFVFKSKM